jgi:hypothetical protein
MITRVSSDLRSFAVPEDTPFCFLLLLLCFLSLGGLSEGFSTESMEDLDLLEPFDRLAY